VASHLLQRRGEIPFVGSYNLRGRKPIATSSSSSSSSSAPTPVNQNTTANHETPETVILNGRITALRASASAQSSSEADCHCSMAQPHCNHDDVHSTLRQMTRIHPWRIKRRGLNNVHSALFSMPTAKLTGEECQENAEPQLLESNGEGGYEAQFSDLAAGTYRIRVESVVVQRPVEPVTDIVLVWDNGAGA
jgi:hypothetical protein